MRKFRKLSALILALAISASLAVPAFAAAPNEVVGPLSNQGYSNVTLEVKDTSGGGGDTGDGGGDTDIIIATVPVELPIVMDLDGNITVPTDAKIINHVTDKAIAVTAIDATTENGWIATDWSDDFATKLDDAKELGLSFRGDSMGSDGQFTLTSGNWTIEADSTIDLNMGAKIPKQTVESTGKIATIGFTIDWAEDSRPPVEVNYTISFIADTNGKLEGNLSTEVLSGSTISEFPSPIPINIAYEFDKWVDANTNEEITSTTVITSDMTIKAVFRLHPASPQEWFTTDGKNTITGLSSTYLNLVDAPTDLVIPNNIGGSSIKAIGESAFKNKDLITSVVIPNSVTTIEKYAFDGCSSLTDVVLSENLTTVKYRAFYQTKVKSLILPDSVTIVGKDAFDGLQGPTYIEMPASFRVCDYDGNFGTDGCESPFGAAGGTYNFPDVTVKIRSGLTELPEHLFEANGGTYKITKVKHIIIPDSVETIGASYFRWCSATETIVIERPKDSVVGSPWGATKATITWLG